MRTLLSLLLLLSPAAIARADATPPPFTSISREVVLEFAEPYKGWTFFAVAGRSRSQRVSTTTPVALSELLGDNYTTRRMGVMVYAIPDDLLAEIGSPTADLKWYERNDKDPRVRRLGVGVLSISTTYADPRARVIDTYRVTMTPTELETELVSEKVEYGTPSCVCGSGCMLFAGLIAFVVWRRRRNSLTRTTPPPGK
jgi:hypothetical protein